MAETNSILDLYLQKNPINIIDIGARYGTQPNFKGIEKYCNVFAFEPDEKECLRLMESDLKTRYNHYSCYPFIVGDKNGPQTIHITENPGGSSIFLYNSKELEGFKYKESIKPVHSKVVETKRLDDILLDPDNCPMDYANIDVHGSECNVINGGDKIFEKDVLFVNIEMWFNETYKGQPVFRDVDGLLAQKGFKLLYFTKIRQLKRENVKTFYNTCGEAFWTNAYYVRYPSFFYEKSEDTDRLIRFLLILHLFLHPGYALYVLDSFEKETGKIIPDNFSSLFRNFIEAYYTSPKSYKVKKFLYQKLMQILHKFT
jgi:FkbM family methyltransferase